jgi:hypothetical protein
MAIARFGGGVIGLRGTLGGNTFSANTNGAYVRAWANIPNPRSLAQSYKRFYWQFHPSNWAAISPSQKTDWNNYGKAHALQNPLGEWYHLNGYQWFCSCNQNLACWGGPAVQDAPTALAPVPVAPLSMEYDNAASPYRCQVTITEFSFAGLWLVPMFRPDPHSGRTTMPSGFRAFPAFFDLGAGVTELNWWISHGLNFGPPQLGYRGFFRVYTGDAQGLRSGPWAASLEYTEI